MIASRPYEIKLALQRVSRATRIGLGLLVLALVWGAWGQAFGQDSLGPALNELFESAKTSRPGSPSRKQAQDKFDAAAKSPAPEVSPGVSRPFGAVKGTNLGQVAEPEPVVIPSSGKPRLIEFSKKKK